MTKAYDHKKIDEERYFKEIASVLEKPYGVPFLKLWRSFMSELSDAGRHTDLALHLEAYRQQCPQDKKEAASWLGNGGWYAYRSALYERFLELTDKALNFAPDNPDWLMCNRAFALYLLNQREDAWDAYQDAINYVSDQKRWHNCAVVDLEEHGARMQAEPVEYEFIEKVKALGKQPKYLPHAPDNCTLS